MAKADVALAQGARATGLRKIVMRLVTGGEVGVIAALVGHDLNDRWRLIGGALVRSWGEGGANFG